MSASPVDGADRGVIAGDHGRQPRLCSGGGGRGFVREAAAAGERQVFVFEEGSG